MSLIWETPFIVVDVETTGPKAERDKIIDIACITVLGGEIISEYQSLINPHQYIPPYILEMTKINYAMLLHAPEVEEIAPIVYQILNIPNAVFVAHNAKFDWSFLKNTFQSLGLEIPKIPVVCTLKLANKLIRGKKKNVGALAENFKIPIQDRHRAYGDATATAYIFNELIDILEEEYNITTIDDLLKFQNQPVKQYKPKFKVVNRLMKYIENLPKEAGVYYFLDENDIVIYVGKSKNIRDRVKSYFFEASNSFKINALLEKTYKINYVTTETELEALILESREIKRLKPQFNVISRNYKSYPLIKITAEDFPRIEVVDRIDDDNADYFGPFSSKTLAINVYETIRRNFKLRKCNVKINPNKDKPPCFYFFIKRCNSPCSENISKEEYGEEVSRVKNFLSSYDEGIIEFYEEEMNNHSNLLEFEQAQGLKNDISELKKIFHRFSKVPTSINKNNYAFILPSDSHYRRLQVFLIKCGKLVKQFAMGRKANLSVLMNEIHEIYYNGKENSLQFSQKDMDELRILLSWINKKRYVGKFVYFEDKNENEALKELENTIRNFELD